MGILVLAIKYLQAGDNGDDEKRQIIGTLINKKALKGT